MPKRKATKTSSPKNSLWQSLPNYWTELLQHKILFVVLLILFVISGYIRVFPIFNNNTHFSFDQAQDLVYVKQLVHDRKISLVARHTGLQGILMGPWYTWMMIPSFFFSGGNPNADVVYMTILGLISSGLIYVITRHHTNIKFATILTFFSLLGPYFIKASRIIFSPSPLAFTSIILLHLLIEIIKNKKYHLAPWLALACSFLFQFEIGFGIFMTPAVILTLLIWTRGEVLTPKNLVLSTVAFTFPFVPQIIFDIRHQFIMSKSLLGFVQGTNTSLGQENLTYPQLLFQRFGSLKQDLITSTLFESKHKLKTLILLGLMSIGIIRSKFKSDPNIRSIFYISITLTISLYFLFSLVSTPIWSWYRIGIHFFLTVLAAYSLYHIPKLILIPLFAAITLNILWPNLPTDSNLNHDGGVATIRNQHHILDSIYSDAEGQPFSLYVYTPPVYPYIWDYQLFYYAKPKYGYYPTAYDVFPQPNNPELIYLIIEPDDDYIHRITGWKGNFSVYGEAIDSWNLPGNVIVEKWHFHTQPTNTQPLIRPADLFKYDSDFPKNS